MSTKTVQLLSLGNLPRSLMKELEEPLIVQLGVIPQQGKLTLPAPDYAFNKDRNQYHCHPILRRLGTLVRGQVAMIGITEVDLFEPDAPFIFGEVDRESKVALVSVFRLQEASRPDLLKRRLQVETVHQAGRLVGLSPCEEPRCTMYVATTVADCDRRNLGLCSVCRNELAKLTRATPVSRAVAGEGGGGPAGGPKET